MQNLAIIGAGNFAQFSAREMLKNNAIHFTGVLDTVPDKAKQFQTEFGGQIFTDMLQITTDASIDLVYIATPPWLHYPHARQCLLAGKHVICEKPAALRVAEAEELIRIAREKEKLYVVNLMQRYNPLFAVVQNIIAENILGAFLHGFFENYASDEFLEEDHWFWDEAKSGGIFVEHGVHFFDLFEGWLGEGKLLSAIELKRKNSPIQHKAADRVQATVDYAGGIVNFYHGFDQPVKLDRQEIRLVFEKGNINLYEWVPTRMKIEALLSIADLSCLQELVPDGTLNILDQYSGTAKIARGRFKQINADYKIELQFQGASKAVTYQRLIADMLTDQLRWVEERGHKRMISGHNALSSLKIAAAAHQQAQIIGTA